MRTAARKHVVAFKTFLRTLIHELCHHLDYELFKLPETFHTEGFYKRESTLVNALLRGGRRPTAAPDAVRIGSESAPLPRSVATGRPGSPRQARGSTLRNRAR